MSAKRSVLVVDSDSSDLVSTVLLLQSAGYHVVSAKAFDEAKQLLAGEAPDLLITGLRLGQYNGLHLILRSRTAHPAMAAIVTSPYHDSVLEAEAQRQRAGFVVRPIPDSAFLEAVSRSLREAVAALQNNPGEIAGHGTPAAV
jgi:DNA-binding NtrC family response regulator